MNIISGTIEELFAELSHMKMEAVRDTHPWQFVMPWGQEFVRMEHGFTIYGYLLKSEYPEDVEMELQQPHSRLCWAASVACPEGELGSVWSCSIPILLPKGTIEKLQAQGWPDLHGHVDLQKIIEYHKQRIKQLTARAFALGVSDTGFDMVPRSGPAEEVWFDDGQWPERRTPQPDDEISNRTLDSRAIIFNVLRWLREYDPQQAAISYEHVVYVHGVMPPPYSVKSDVLERADEVLADYIEILMSNYAPTGYYFGSSPGSYSDIGWHPDEERDDL